MPPDHSSDDSAGFPWTPADGPAEHDLLVWINGDRKSLLSTEHLVGPTTQNQMNGAFALEQSLERTLCQGLR